MEFTGGFHVFRLRALAFNAAFDVAAYVIPNARPPVVPCDHFLCFVLSGASRRDGVMMFLYDVTSEFSVYRYVDPIFPRDDPVVAFSPFRVFISKCLSNRLVDVVYSFLYPIDDVILWFLG